MFHRLPSPPPQSLPSGVFDRLKAFEFSSESLFTRRRLTRPSRSRLRRGFRRAHPCLASPSAATSPPAPCDSSWSTTTTAAMGCRRRFPPAMIWLISTRGSRYKPPAGSYLSSCSATAITIGRKSSRSPQRRYFRNPQIDGRLGRKRLRT